MLILAIAICMAAGVISGYQLGVAVGQARETTLHLDAQAKRLGLPPYDHQRDGL